MTRISTIIVILLLCLSAVFPQGIQDVNITVQCKKPQYKSNAEKLYLSNSEYSNDNKIPFINIELYSSKIIMLITYDNSGNIIEKFINKNSSLFSNPSKYNNAVFFENEAKRIIWDEKVTEFGIIDDEMNEIIYSMSDLKQAVSIIDAACSYLFSEGKRLGKYYYEEKERLNKLYSIMTAGKDINENMTFSFGNGVLIKEIHISSFIDLKEKYTKIEKGIEYIDSSIILDIPYNEEYLYVTLECNGVSGAYQYSINEIKRIIRVGEGKIISRIAPK